MAARKKSKQSTSLRIGTNPNFKELFDDFADYQGVRPFVLATDLIAEHHQLVDSLDPMNLTDVWTMPERAIPGYILGNSGAVITAHTEPDVLAAMVSNTERLQVSVTWIARMALYHGLVVNMEAEHFTAPAL